MKELDYIYTKGNSLISLPIICKSTLKIQIDLMMTNATGGYIIGNSRGEPDSFRFFNPNQTVYLDFGSGGGYNRITGGNLYNNTRYNIEIGNRYVKNLSNDSYFCQGSQVEAFTKTYNVLMFVGDRNCKGYFYSLKIYDDNKLVFDAFPAMNDDGDIGLYDTITHKLYPNTGTGPLTYGSVVREFSEELYLIKSVDSFYSVDGTKLDNVTTLTSSVFEAYGSVNAPSSDVLKTLTNPSILIWSNDEVSPHQALITATPFPQTIITDKIYLTDDSITGIESVLATCEGDLIVAVSFDDKQTWKAWNGEQWVTLSDDNAGMSKETLEAITFEQWNELYTGATGFYVRVSLLDTTQTVEKIVFDFSN